MTKTLDLQPSLVDKMVNWFDPVKGSERLKARAMQGVTMSAFGGGGNSYHAASTTRRGVKSWFTRSKSADQDLNRALPDIRSRCRDLHRNDPLARGAINTVVTNVVGTGLAPQPSIWAETLGLSADEADAWQRKTLNEFLLWAEDPECCDLTHTQDFYGLQELAFRSTLLNGDHFTVLPEEQREGQPYRLKLQMIEGDRVCNPAGLLDGAQLSNGIRLNANGAPLGFHIMTAHPGGVHPERKWQYIDRLGAQSGRRNVIHLFERLRSEQHRGEPYLAPVVEPLKQLSRYSEAELMAAVISGMFTVFISTELDDIGAGESDGVPDYALGNGAIITGMPGDKPEIINPGRPNALFDPFVQAILRQIGVALEIPFELLIKHYTSSYTAARAAFLDAWRFFRKRRAWLATYFCQPIYETWLDEAVARGRIVAPGYFADPLRRKAWRACTWVGDSPGAIDPVKEAVADEKNLALGKTTLAKACMAHDGSNWEDNHRQQVRERQARIRDGLLADPAADSTLTAEPEDDPPPNRQNLD